MDTPSRRRRVASGTGWLAACLALTLLGAWPCRTRADLAAYDAALDAESAAGPRPASRLRDAVTLSAGKTVPWNFGTIPGDATFEFILEGDRTSQSAYLAVGANTSSNLRFAQWPGTGQLGFTQLGVRDYQFTPPVGSPTNATHIAFVWESGPRVMRVFRNGEPAGTSTGIDASFAMPTQSGRLGANPSGTEAMTGILHRLATYASVLPAETIRTHAHAFLGLVPRPAVLRFSADRTYFRAGDPVELQWSTRNASRLEITPGPGDVTPLSPGGTGTLRFQPLDSQRLVLRASHADESDEAVLRLHRIAPAAHPVLSECVADDRTVLADEDGEHTGWIEILNPSSGPVDLAGWSLTDDPSRPNRWLFPSTNLPPGGYLVVFASNKDRRVAGRPLHLNFGLRNAGEYLALISPDGTLRHAFDPGYPAQPPDAAYGIHGGDPATAGALAWASPGQPNPDLPTPPGPVIVSPAGGTFTNVLEISLRSPDPDARIWFTLDGSEPSPTHGTPYTAPFTIRQTTRVRARAVAQGLAGPVGGTTHLRLAPELSSYTSPLPLLVIENFGAGVIPQKGWNTTGAGLRQVHRQTAVWATFDRAGSEARFNQPPQMLSLVGIRGRGAYSTEWRQKPYSVEAIGEDGQERPVAPLHMPAHADWVLYYPDSEANRDPTLLFNTFAYDLSRSFGGYAVRFRWVEVFVNEDGGDLSLADRRGVYALLERVSRGPERLDFDSLSPDGTTGGWLLNINRMDPEPEDGWPAPNGATRPSFFHTAGPNRRKETTPDTTYSRVPGDDQPQQPNAFINFDNPNGYTLNRAQRAAIEQWFASFEDVLYDDTRWRDPLHGYRPWIDVRNFVDYFILNTLTRNGDGLLISIFPWKGNDGRLRIGPAWDYNWASYYVSGGPTGSLLHRADRLWYARLFADPDFTQDFIDRWWELRAGPLGNLAMSAIVDRQAAEITPAKALLNGLPTTAEWSRRLTQLKSWLNQRANWIDTQYTPPPAVHPPGGELPEGTEIVLSAPAGALYVTTDGTDPRAPGGAVADSARLYNGPIALRQSIQLRARVRTAAGWSGLRAANFTLPNPLAGLAITELMYHPPARPPWSDADLEFVELRNHGTTPLDLGGAAFANGISFVFPPGTRLDPGSYLVLAPHADAFRAAHPRTPLHGVYDGQLANSGESLRLDNASGQPVLTVTFDDDAPWPTAADGRGRSLVPREDATGVPADSAAAWRASTEPGGSPGAPDPSVFTTHPLSQDAVPGQPITLSVGIHPGLSRPLSILWHANGVPPSPAILLSEGEFAFLNLTAPDRPTEYRVSVVNADHPDGLLSQPSIISPIPDSDLDGLPDAWETAHGFDPRDARDRDLDPDGDGVGNAQEYLAGTDPRDGAQRLHLQGLTHSESQGFVARFEAQPLRTYALEAADALGTGPWIVLATFAAENAPRPVTVPIPTRERFRYFRLVTPCPP